MKTTAASNPARKGSTSADGKVVTSFETDVKVSQSWMDYADLQVLGQHTFKDTSDVVFDIQYTIRQVYDLQTGQKVASPQPQVIKEAARFGLEEGSWVFLSSDATNWDRDALQLKPATVA